MESGVAAPADVELVPGGLGEFRITIDGRVAFDKAEGKQAKKPIK